MKLKRDKENRFVCLGGREVYTEEKRPEFWKGFRAGFMTAWMTFFLITVISVFIALILL